MSRGLKILTLMVIVITITLIGGISYALLMWNSPSSDISLETENIQLMIDGGADISGVSLVPVDDKSKGIIKDFTITNDNDFDVYLSISLDINTFDASLCDSSFVYALYEVDKSNEEFLFDGNFANVNQDLLFILGSDIKLEKKTEKNYRLYIWIDSNLDNPYEMMGKSFNFILKIDVTTSKSKISETIIQKTGVREDEINLATSIEQGDFFILKRAPMGTNYQVNLEQYEYRYVGNNPSNYIYFNCSNEDTNNTKYGDDDYEYDTTNCELWRIIGVFLTEVPVYDDNENITSYKWEYLTKIIRNDSIGNLAWDSSKVNEWSTSSLMKILNPGFSNSSEYYNRSGNYTTTGLKDVNKKNIQSVKWYLGAVSDYTFTNNYYLTERSNNVCNSSRSKNWVGKIALMYPSDYGYAAGKFIEENYVSSLYYAVNNKNWLYTGNSEWLISPSSVYCGEASMRSSNGVFGYNGSSTDYHTTYQVSVRPTLYLKSNTYIKLGNGTIESPYIIE